MKCKGISQNAYTDDILEWSEIEKKYLKSGKKLDSKMFEYLLAGGS